MSLCLIWLRKLFLGEVYNLAQVESAGMEPSKACATFDCFNSNRMHQACEKIISLGYEDSPLLQKYL